MEREQSPRGGGGVVQQMQWEWERQAALRQTESSRQTGRQTDRHTRVHTHTHHPLGSQYEQRVKFQKSLREEKGGGERGSKEGGWGGTDRHTLIPPQPCTIQ